MLLAEDDTAEDVADAVGDRRHLQAELGDLVVG